MTDKQKFLDAMRERGSFLWFLSCEPDMRGFLRVLYREAVVRSATPWEALKWSWISQEALKCTESAEALSARHDVFCDYPVEGELKHFAYLMFNEVSTERRGEVGQVITRAGRRWRVIERLCPLESYEQVDLLHGMQTVVVDGLDD